MGKLVGIPGVKSGEVQCKSVGSITELLRDLRHGSACVAAGDNGAISVWVGDDGYFYSEFSRRLCVINGVNIIGPKRKLREWLKEWWSEMGDRNQIARL